MNDTHAKIIAQALQSISNPDGPQSAPEISTQHPTSGTTIAPSLTDESITEAALARYTGDLDSATGEPVDDWGYSEAERRAFIAGAHFALETKDRAARAALDSVVGSVVQNANNFPEPHRILGRDITRLREALIDALVENGFTNEHQ